MPRGLPSLKAKALACVAQREHSRVELRRKLLDHARRLARADAASLLTAASNTAPDEPAATDETPGSAKTRSEGRPDAGVDREIEALLDWLVARDLLNAERFVDMRVQVRSARFGNLRIQHELARHGHALDPDAAQALKDSEWRRAQAVWARRFGEVAADAAGRAKQARFLAARGFSADAVRRVVAGLAED